ncbi:hypothetical protein ACOMHN_007141 [Nucella lapillus]
MSVKVVVVRWLRRYSLNSVSGKFRKMRLRNAKGIFCLLVVGATLMLAALLLLRNPTATTTTLPLTFTHATSHPPRVPATSSSSSLHRAQDVFMPRDHQPRPLHDAPASNHTFLVPSRPPKGDTPRYPVREELREETLLEGKGGGGGGGVKGAGEGGGEGGGLDPEMRQEPGLVGEVMQSMGVVLWNASSGLLARSGTAVKREEEDNPLKVADGLWDLIMTPKVKVTDENQQEGPFTCAAKYHIFFGKVHKTGSSTVANILQRYGFLRDLNFVLPRKRISVMSYNYLSMPGQSPSRAMLIPPPMGQRYDVLWCHGIYHRAFYHGLMPPDTVYVTILRHPLEQFLSSFEYYGQMPGSYLTRMYHMKNVSNPLSVYLRDPSRYEDPRKMTSFIRNKQSQDLGMTTEHVQNATLRHHYIQQLGHDFHLVMMTEFFDESLVLLRRLMCWSLRDIIYITKNKNAFKKERSFSPEDLARHRQLNVADFELYEFFHDRFQRTLKEQGSDFKQEVEMYKRLLKRVLMYCTRWSGNDVTFKVPATRWSGAFVLTSYDCTLMHKPELAFLNDLILDTVRKYQRSAVQHYRS